MLHGLPHAYTADLRSALCIGMGMGIVPRSLARDGVEVDVVEINPGLVPLAEDWFGFKPEALRHLEIGDGRHFLNRSQEQYDAVVLDAFLGDSTPTHLTTVEAFSAMRDRLRPAGVLVLNSFGHILETSSDLASSDLVFNGPDDLFTTSLNATLKMVFPHIKIHASGNGNVFFVASMSPLKAHRLPTFPYSHHSLKRHQNLLLRPQTAWDQLWRVTDGEGIVMTDDFNPINYHDAAHHELTREISVAGL
jgi:hypothetical protein